MQVIDFPTRITNNNGTLIDTNFVDTTIYDKIQVKPFISDLSDHNTKIICLPNVNSGLQQSVTKIKSRLNINLLTKSYDALKFVALMTTFNLMQVVDFPTRITNNN